MMKVKKRGHTAWLYRGAGWWRSKDGEQSVCMRGVSRHFSVPKNAKRIRLHVSRTPIAGAVRSKPGSFSFFFVLLNMGLIDKTSAAEWEQFCSDREAVLNALPDSLARLAYSLFNPHITSVEPFWWWVEYEA